MADPNIVALVDRYAKKYGIPTGLYRALIQQESGYNPRAVSPAGARGLGQLMPGTASGLGVADSFDPEQNLDGSARYLRDQYKKFGKWNLALAAYNAGPGNVAKYGGIPPFSETQAYVKKILSQAGDLSNVTSELIDQEGVNAGRLGATEPLGLPGGQTPGMGAQEVQGIDLPAFQAASSRRSRLQEAFGKISDYTGAQMFKLPDVNPNRFLSTRSVPQQLSPAQTAQPGLPLEDTTQDVPQSGNFVFDPKDSSWGGSKTRALTFKNLALNQFKLGVMSEKRDRQHTSSGGVSDHWTGSKNNYAFDLSNGSNPTPEMDRAAKHFAAMLGVKDWGYGVLNKEIGGYRYQLLYRTNVGGNHFNHIHIGVRKL